MRSIDADQLEQRIQQLHDRSAGRELDDGRDVEWMRLQAEIHRLKQEQPELARIAERMQCQLELLVERCGTDGSVLAHQRPVDVNLSAQGIAFDSDRAVQPGDWAELTLQLTAVAAGVTILARVVRCQPLKEQPGICRIALDFEHILEADRQSIARYIMERQRQQLVRPTGDL